MKNDKIIAGLLGYGTVGYGVKDIIDQNPNMEVKYVLVRSEKKELGSKAVTDINTMLQDPEVNVIIEAMGGLSPAYEYVKESLLAGKNVVSSNKQLIAHYYDELNELAKEHDVALRCTAAVGGGIPWLTNLERTKRINKVSSISGIMNGTTNYILDAMHKNNADFAAVLEEAQKLGYAEADPSADIDGLDIQRKCLISVNVAFDVSVDEDKIPVFGIRHIKSCDIEAAKALGRTCKMLAIGKQLPNGKIAAFVEPTFVKDGKLEAAVSDNYNLVSFDGEYSGPQSYFGQGAGRYPTAYNVVGDCEDIRCGKKVFYTSVSESRELSNEEEKHAYYFRGISSEQLIDELKENACGEGFVSKEISVSRAHEIAAENPQDDFFMAGIGE